jgi:hypothetical protein
MANISVTIRLIFHYTETAREIPYKIKKKKKYWPSVVINFV